jgi:uncharacterized membrane protein YjgN (DUF898 family)
MRRRKHQVPRQRQRYFRIWIVNLLLTIATLGIYSAWAKVRRNHMYSCTSWPAPASNTTASRWQF